MLGSISRADKYEASTNQALSNLRVSFRKNATDFEGLAGASYSSENWPWMKYTATSAIMAISPPNGTG